MRSHIIHQSRQHISLSLSPSLSSVPSSGRFLADAGEGIGLLAEQPGAGWVACWRRRRGRGWASVGGDADTDGGAQDDYTHAALPLSPISMQSRALSLSLSFTLMRIALAGVEPISV